jgi:hypothetical protein
VFRNQVCASKETDKDFLTKKTHLPKNSAVEQRRRRRPFRRIKGQTRHYKLVE